MTVKRKEENNGVNVLRVVGLESSHLGVALPEVVYDVNVGSIFYLQNLDLFASLGDSKNGKIEQKRGCFCR